MKLIFPFLLVFLPSFLYASSFSTSFISISMGELSAGTTYNITKYKDQPLKVTNKSEKPLNIKIKVQSPEAESLLKGYDVIPSTSWINIGVYDFLLQHKQVYKTDVLLYVPKDKKYAGKSYQVNIEIFGYPENKQSGSFIMVPSVLSKIFFTVKKEKKSFWKKLLPW